MRTKKVSINRTKKPPPSKRKSAAAKALDLTLPTEPNEPPTSIGAYIFLIYGLPKIGKTSIVSHFEKVFYMSFEPGTKALKGVYSRPVNTWEEFTKYVDLLEDGEHSFKTVCIDTCDLCYQALADYWCRKEKIQDIGEIKDYGVTWRKVKKELRTQILRLTNQNIGVVFISHTTEKEFESPIDGESYERQQPSASKQALELFEPMADVIGFYHFVKSQRFLRIEGTNNMLAGCRLEENFIRLGGKPRTEGDRIETIPMGKTSKQAYDNLLKAFNNEQEITDPVKLLTVTKNKTTTRKKTRTTTRRSN